MIGLKDTDYAVMGVLAVVLTAVLAFDWWVRRHDR